MMGLHLFPRLYRCIDDPEDSLPWVRAKPRHWHPLDVVRNRLSVAPTTYYREVDRLAPGVWRETGQGWHCRQNLWMDRIRSRFPDQVYGLLRRIFA